MKKDFSYLGCKYHPQAYDADTCEKCTYDEECYARFLQSMRLMEENIPIHPFGKMNKLD